MIYIYIMDDILKYVDEKYKVNKKRELENSDDIYSVNNKKKNITKNDNNTIKYINKSFSFITKTSANNTKLAYDFNFNVDFSYYFFFHLLIEDFK